METSLHQQLKRSYGGDDSNTEVTIGRYRIDALRDEELIEVQCASLSAIRDKCNNLLRRHQLRVVKPIISRTRIVKIDKADGKVISRRMSPKKGSLVDVFEELIYFTRVFPHPNLTIELPLIVVEQYRIPQKKKRWRHKGYKVQDTRLESISDQHELRSIEDLLRLVRWPEDDSKFNTADLADTIGRPRWVAQKVAYVLRKTGAIEEVGRDKSGVIYRRAA